MILHRNINAFKRIYTIQPFVYGIFWIYEGLDFEFYKQQKRRPIPGASSTITLVVARYIILQVAA